MQHAAVDGVFRCVKGHDGRPPIPDVLAKSGGDSIIPRRYKGNLSNKGAVDKVGAAEAEEVRIAEEMERILRRGEERWRRKEWACLDSQSALRAGKLSSPGALSRQLPLPYGLPIVPMCWWVVLPHVSGKWLDARFVISGDLPRCSSGIGFLLHGQVSSREPAVAGYSPSICMGYQQ